MTNGTRYLGRNILVQTAAKGYIQHLEATADSEDRLLLLPGQPDQLEVIAVLVTVDVVDLRHRIFSIILRRNIFTAGNQQSVDHIHIFCAAGRIFGHRDQHRNAACINDSLYISLLDHVIADTDALKYKTNESDSWLFHTVTCFRCIDTGNFPVLCLLTFLLYRIRKQL